MDAKCFPTHHTRINAFNICRYNVEQAKSEAFFLDYVYCNIGICVHF